MSSTEDRLAALEARIERLERRLAGASSGVAQPAPPRPPPARPPSSGPPQPPPARPSPPAAGGQPSAPAPAAAPAPGRGERTYPIGATVLGLGGAIALVLSGMYLVRLAIEAGWLTPVRQVTLAGLAGLALIAVGLALAPHRRRYAALLPATGVVILFLTVYGAHLFHALIDAPLATAAIAVVCLASLGLGTVFGHGLYVLFAVIGAYATPFLMAAPLDPDLMDVLLYYSAWSVLFCAHAVWQGSRGIYLIAMYLAIIGFDLIWRSGGGGDWPVAAVYQAIQFLVFTAAVVVFSLRWRRPMNDTEAWAHLPALLIFYALEYSILDSGIPAAAPWIAFVSLLLLLAAHLLATRIMEASTRGSAVIVGAYAAVVLFHAGYMELLPGRLAPWAVLVVAAVAGVAGRGGWSASPLVRPSLLALGLAFFLNTMRVLVEFDMSAVPGEGLLRWLYPLALYGGYVLLRGPAGPLGLRMVMLYAAHVAAMAAVAWEVEASFQTSVGWGVIAVASLLVALRFADRTLGRSSFIVFGFSALKVLVYDLAGAAPLVRIGSLAALGVSLFIGGWLYQELNRRTSPGSDSTTSSGKGESG